MDGDIIYKRLCKSLVKITNKKHWQLEPSSERPKSYQNKN